LAGGVHAGGGVSRRLWFVMPAHGRLVLSEICMEQLSRVCDSLRRYGIEATCVVVADDENLNTAWRLGFATVRSDNRFLARKYNDGIQLALDPEYNDEPADYVVPIGSDDWVDDRIFHRLPASDAVLGFRHIAFVNETGTELAETVLSYEGGAGIRVYPRQLLQPTGYRPADEDRRRGCDTSILWNTRHEYHREHGGLLRVVYGDLHTRQIVDWKTAEDQMNTYTNVASRHSRNEQGDPFLMLDGLYPADLLDRMEAHYGR
jgi:hypothetical protein